MDDDETFWAGFDDGGDAPHARRFDGFGATYGAGAVFPACGRALDAYVLNADAPGAHRVATAAAACLARAAEPGGPVLDSVQETPRNVDVFGLWRPLSRSHRFWLLPWDRLIISARVLEISTQNFARIDSYKVMLKRS